MGRSTDTGEWRPSDEREDRWTVDVQEGTGGRMDGGTFVPRKFAGMYGGARCCPETSK